MDKVAAKKAREELEAYLATGNHRRTEERFVILDTIYSFSGTFNIDALSARLEKRKFMVSRATLYNAIKLFIKLRLIMRHKMEGESLYEPSIGRKSHFVQICTVCGGKKELKVKSMLALKNNLLLERFQGESYDITVYGICSSCKAVRTRMQRREERMRKKAEKLKELHAMAVKNIKH